MGRERADHPAATVSSIALLQERFRQLQRVKEMREEKALLRTVSESERFSPTVHYEPTRFFFHPELIHPPRPPLHVSLCLSHNWHAKSTHFPSFENPHFNTWPAVTPFRRPSSAKYDDDSDHSDVDTSLHL